jgi:hypothetical protein
MTGSLKQVARCEDGRSSSKEEGEENAVISIRHILFCKGINCMDFYIVSVSFGTLKLDFVNFEM